MEILSGSRDPLFLCLFLDPFPLPCPTLKTLFLFYLIFYFVTLGWYLLEVCSFLMKHRKEVDLHWRGCRKELWGVERGMTVIRIYCIRKGSILIKVEKLKEKNEYMSIQTWTMSISKKHAKENHLKSNFSLAKLNQRNDKPLTKMWDQKNHVLKE